MDINQQAQIEKRLGEIEEIAERLSGTGQKEIEEINEKLDNLNSRLERIETDSELIIHELAALKVKVDFGYEVKITKKGSTPA